MATSVKHRVLRVKVSGTFLGTSPQNIHLHKISYSAVAILAAENKSPANAPFLRNISAIEGGGYNSFEFLKKLEANFCTRMYGNWQRCPFNP